MTDIHAAVVGLLVDAGIDAQEAAGLSECIVKECFRWLPIEMAEKVTAKEILGSRWASGTCIREPFVSFWSPTLNKFYGSPTHYVPIPHSPEDQK